MKIGWHAAIHARVEQLEMHHEASIDRGDITDVVQHPEPRIATACVWRYSHRPVVPLPIAPSLHHSTSSHAFPLHLLRHWAASVAFHPLGWQALAFA